MEEERKKAIRSVSFDTSFLLKDSPDIDKVIKQLKRYRIPCYVTSTVLSELEQLRVWGRIDERTYGRAMSRWRRVRGTVIDFRNRLISSEIGRQCMASMEEHHGVKQKDIANDCSIIVTSLKNGIDLFLSEDFHFTSRITEDVLDEITNNACIEYKQMCGEDMHAIDSKTFLQAYMGGELDLKIVASARRDVKKPGKRIGRF
ncbi:MAG: type II toxin-antitoxin system VapC family toxin [Thermoplasmata archaeon]|nr:MAG: type II toxin-antitoxin system VapC family toxin [Thermoplasmata archaeon]